MQSQTVLITGASRGLGLELARQFAAAGHHVIAANRGVPKERLDQVEYVTIDLDSEGSITELAQRLNGRAIDVLINNAAIAGDEGGLPTLRPDEFLAVIRTNTLAPLLMVKHFMPHLMQGRRRVIANISSRVGSISEGIIDEGNFAYCISKSALNMASAKLCFHYGHEGFCVLSLHPGWVQTDMGGPEATLDVKASAAGLIRVITTATAHDNGTYRNFDGKMIGW
jgi:NAD(P)-dependent dehydrogenase (short-subunit alcohol dehydrogenase family)